MQPESDSSDRQHDQNDVATRSDRVSAKGAGPGINLVIAMLRTVADLSGKLWALPNTVVGLLIGLAGLPAGASITLGHNAIQFERYPWGRNNTALTLGNVILYCGDAAPERCKHLYGSTCRLNVGLHEQGHTLQYQFFGPLFVPLYLLAGGISATNPFEQGANRYAAGGSWWPRKG